MAGRVRRRARRRDRARSSRRISAPGWSNSLGQKLLQLAGPGVPDVYQGTELWDFSLVDPDNRRPVDYASARDAAGARSTTAGCPTSTRPVRPSCWSCSARSRLRRDRPELFSGYVPLAADGPAAAHAIAFARSDNLVAVATRLPVGLEPPRRVGGHGAAAARRRQMDRRASPTGRWTARRRRLADLLERYPVALLVRPAAA